jgi:hypothetical protein
MINNTSSNEAHYLFPKHKAANSCPAVLCDSCQCVKQALESDGFQQSKQLKYGHNLTPQHLPGECVSIDQYVSALPGRLRHNKGKEKKPPNTTMALFLWIMRQHAFIIAIKSPSVLEKLSKPSTILKKSPVTMVSVSRITTLTMIILALATSGLISKFKIKNYPFQALAHIIKMA